jgi:D(-)-tartrate dehydratase
VKIKEIRELSIPLQGAISNSVVSFSDHDVSLVAVISDQIRDGQPLIGFGFNSIGRYAQRGILQDRIVPRILAAGADQLLGADGFDCAAVLKTAMRNEKPGGHGDRASAIAAVELAFWDLNAKLADEPAYATIARAYQRTPSKLVAVYAAGGYYYPQAGLESLKTELDGYLDGGFDAFKIKIGGASLAEDVARIEVALSRCRSGRRLAVDANGRFDIDMARAYARAIAPYELRWYEEIGDPLDYALNRQISELYVGAIATGENLFSVADVRNLLRFGGMRPGLDIFQMDAGLSYGLTEFARMIESLESAGFTRAASFPHGGHLINLHIAAGLNLGGCEAYPTVFQPFGGFLPELRVENGFISLPQHPGFGLERKPNLKPHLERISA